MAARAAAVVDRVLATQRTSGVRADDLEDIRSTVLLRLVTRMRRDAQPIENFETFVSTATYNAINDHLRRRYPERARLKNRVRYLLMHDGELALWHGHAGLLCGLRREAGGVRPTGRTPGAGELSGEVFARHEEKPALLAIFARAGGSLTLDDVIALLAEAWNVAEARSVDPDLLCSVAVDAELSLEQRRDLATLWSELLLLPATQRTALLLNLRDDDGGNALALVVLLGVASFDDVAAAAGLTPERLAELWSDLPQDDNRIAAQLGVSRQQVINLRSSGRRRLVRRMDAREGGRS
jgi:DNA-directed RNA polymerase specialized sigma24 family protein